ncbi:MAG: winged helix-turn-helix transcriptional regulator [Candidatus Dojkabacteria bacterium]|nr:winged helix-turn-helix transcriptional regulator [Candidatus Dojkabacteria bacterium]MDQ7021075.1 winged helix-turn-helix transcriptional regulator [Candidatus Dojkabacteria bacterium]
MNDDLGFQLLLYIKDNGAHTATELSEVFNIKRTTLLYQLNFLIEKKLVDKEKKGREVYFKINSLSSIESYFRDKIDILNSQLDKLVLDTTKLNRKLVVIADDFGLTKSISDGCLVAYNSGIISELALILNSNGTKYALDKIIEANIRNVGLNFEYEFANNEHISQTEAINSIKSGIFNFQKDVGFKPSSIYLAKELYLRLEILEEIANYCKENSISLRLPKIINQNKSENYAAEVMMNRVGVKTTDFNTTFEKTFSIYKLKNNILNILNNIEENKSLEINLSPGFIDRETVELVDQIIDRGKHLVISIDNELEEEIKKLNYQIVSFNQL